ncbi:major capsid protein [Pseudovibrio ascidiaceicola]|uniref:major capsid protein n=1 Tax=Pseudovibrio ascidiaceicola TaxID=285279 RepID=UPI003D35DF79
MAHMSLLKDDAFSMASLSGVIEKTPYAPGTLGQKVHFEEKSVRTPEVLIDQVEGQLKVIQTSERGSPPKSRRTRNRRNAKYLETTTLSEGDRINAREVEAVRATGQESEFEQLVEMVMDRSADLRKDMEVTRELHKLGAIHGKLLDADGSVIYDYFDEFKVQAPELINLKLNDSDTQVINFCDDLSRKMQRASKGAWTPGSRILAICGDNAFDAIKVHPSCKETYLAQAGSFLRQGKAFGSFDFGDFEFWNYRGSDTFASDTTLDRETKKNLELIGIPRDEILFVAVNTPGIFEELLAPHASFEFVNTKGKREYINLIYDKDRDMWVDVEMYSYPLYLNKRPDMLFRAKFK